MKKHILTFIFLMTLSSLFAQNSNLIFRSNTVAEIRITIDQSKLDWVYANYESDSLHMCNISFQNENLDINLDSAGFRIRGNYSRDDQKKSFKIDLNEFVIGQDLCGIDKLNLKAESNDPSIIRSKFAFKLYEKIGLAASRVTYTKVYINNNYYGLYEIIEHIDDDFLEYHYKEDTGNLWKCTWPADLNYRGSNPEDYHPYSGDDRPYELKTNEVEYDFSELAHLIDVINNTGSYWLKDSLESVICITDFIKYLAVNIMTGSWDDYRYLKNNYYLYHDPTLDKFRFIPYDYDNTFGIDWVEGGDWGDPNWARINMYSYVVNDGDGRPLSDLIFNDDEYRNLFTHFIDFYTNQVFREDQWKPYGDSIKALIRPHVVQDTYYPREYGFDMNDFDNSYDTNYRNGHVERGLYEFMRKRRESTNNQISWRSEPPSIYHEELLQTGLDVRINASAFHRNGVSSVKVKTFSENYAAISTVNMDQNRISGTSKIEEYDQWSVDFTINENETYYVIVADESNGSQRTWPRHGYAKFENESASDAPLVINEFMASNDATIADAAGQFDDWVEIYNTCGSSIDLGGMFLTDKADNLDKWMFPYGTSLDAGSFLIVWCDEDGDKPQDGLHANFKLSASGEFIALVDIDTISVIDHISFGPQTTDVSYARTSDGGEEWALTGTPTPGASNIITDIFDNMIPFTTTLYPNYPNPFNPRTAISYQLSAISSVDLSIYNLRGRKIETLINETKDQGVYRVDWNASNFASGVYLAVLKVDGKLISTQKMLLVK